MADSKWIETWYRIGRRNPWIREACDPPFTRRSFAECKTLDELRERIGGHCWCTGTAFYLGDLCFINQVEGGSEWLVIRRDVSFESISADLMIEHGTFDGFVRRAQAATDEQLINLTY